MARSLQSKQKQSFFLTDGKKQVLIDWFAGLAAGFLSVSACAPLELARTRLIIVVIDCFSWKDDCGIFFIRAKQKQRDVWIMEAYGGPWVPYIRVKVSEDFIEVSETLFASQSNRSNRL